MTTLTNTNPLSDLAEMISKVGGKPALASRGLVVNGVGSGKTKVWMDEVLRQKVSLTVQNNENLWLYGPSGVGKSTIAPAVLEVLGDRFYRIQGHSGFEAQDWYGGADFDVNGKLRVVYSDIVKAMEEGVPCIVEEFNMIQAMHKGPVFSMLDDAPFVDICINGETRRVKKHPNFFMIATANDNGTGDKLHLYGGGERENMALISRFNVIEVGYLPEDLEMEMLVHKTGLSDKPLLTAMMKVATMSRKVAETEDKAELAISPRTMISWAKAYVGAAHHKATLGHNHIAEMVVSDRLPVSMRDTMLTMVANSMHGIKIDSIKYESR